MWSTRSFGGVALRRLVGREVADHDRAFAHHRVHLHFTAMQLDEGAHQRQSEPGAAVTRTLRATLEPVEYLVLHAGGYSRAGICHDEDHAALGAARADPDGGVLRPEADGIGEQVIEHLHYALLVADEAADIGCDLDLETDAVGGEPVLDALGGEFAPL